MDTLDTLINRGYRIYKMDIKPTTEIKKYFRDRMGLLIEYHSDLKVITVRDAKSESKL